MKNLLCFVFLVGSLAIGSIAVSAQEFANDGADKPKRPNLLRELNLSPDQVKEIRVIYRDKQPLATQALRRQNQAKKALDEAIYADDSSEELVKSRLREFQEAQMEASKLRSEVEFAVRRVLNPEQLQKFRELRQRMMNRIQQPAPAETPLRPVRRLGIKRNPL